MKKITLLFLALFTLTAFSFAQTLNNPKDVDGFYIVKWNCAANNFAASNDFEVDETVTFAFDITGTAFETWLKETPTNAGATRSLALNRWTGFGNIDGDSHRMKPIKNNIYAATWNFNQLAAADFDVAAATTVGAELFVFGQLFGFEYTADAAGASWYVNAVQINPGTESGAIFKSAPYTGTKTSELIENGDFGNAMWGTAYPKIKGYGPPCAVTTSVKNPTISNSPIVGKKFYNVQGMEISKAPATGMYLEKVLRADGTSNVNKLFKVKE